MRKLILVAAMVLLSASSQAGIIKGQTMLAANDEPVATEPAKPAEAPQFIERPPAVDTKPEQPNIEPLRRGDKADTTPKGDKSDRAERPRRRHRSIEARVIYELHRYGIYW